MPSLESCNVSLPQMLRCKRFVLSGFISLDAPVGLTSPHHTTLSPTNCQPGQPACRRVILPSGLVTCLFTHLKTSMDPQTSDRTAGHVTRTPHVSPQRHFPELNMGLGICAVSDFCISTLSWDNMFDCGYERDVAAIQHYCVGRKRITHE